jgi:hypothetical protein
VSTATTPTTPTPTTPAAIPTTHGQAAAATYGSFLECLSHAPDEYSVVRSLMPRFLTNLTAWDNPDLQLTVFVPSDAAFEKFWRLSLDEMRRFPVEHFRSAFTPFVKYSILPKALAPEELAVGVSERTAFHAIKPEAAPLRFVPGKNGGDALAVRARYSLAPLTGESWQCGKGYAHGVDSLLLY